MVGTISEVLRTKTPSYDVQFINVDGVVGRFTVDESDLMPADGRRYDDNGVVKLGRDVPYQNLTVGAVGIVSEVSPGPPVRYTVEFADVRTTLFDADLSSSDEESPEHDDTPTPNEGVIVEEPEEELGLADDEFDALIAELRSQGQAMQQQTAQEEQAAQAPREEAAPLEQAPQEAPTLPEQAPQGEADPEAEQPARPVEPSPWPVAGGARTDDVPPSDGRRTRFVRGETVRLEVDLLSEGFEAGTEGTVTWAMLGPPVAYLVEFRDASGGVGRPTRVEETNLSFAG